MILVCTFSDRLFEKDTEYYNVTYALLVNRTPLEFVEVFAYLFLYFLNSFSHVNFFRCLS